MSLKNNMIDYKDYLARKYNEASKYSRRIDNIIRNQELELDYKFNNQLRNSKKVNYFSRAFLMKLDNDTINTLENYQKNMMQYRNEILSMQKNEISMTLRQKYTESPLDSFSCGMNALIQINHKSQKSKKLNSSTINIAE